MGKQAAYSRLRIWMRNRAPLFSGPIMTRFEIWGTNSPKPLDEIGDGSKEANLRYWTGWPEVGGTNEWQNDWVKLTEAELKLPSGQTDPNLLTNADLEFRSEEHTSELQSLIRITYPVSCLKKKIIIHKTTDH